MFERFRFMRNWKNRDSSLPLPPNKALPPISRNDIKKLFDYLDRPNPEPCTNELEETCEFLREHKLPVEPMIRWLNKNGAFCDCEVILNTDAEWGEWAGRSASTHE